MPTTSARGDEALLNALAAGCPVKEAARAAGLSERTAYRRLASAAFQRRLAALRDELITAALGELASGASEAVATLKRLLKANDERVQLAAARALLEQVLKLREAVSLEQRLAALERDGKRGKLGRRSA